MITSVIAIPIGSATAITVTSSLSGTVYYFWYQDGTFVGKTTSPTRLFVLAGGAGDQSQIDILDSNDPLFDAVANAPGGYPARRTLFFIRSIDPNTQRYRIEQQKNAGSWTVLGYILSTASQWSYQYPTPRLTDLATYAWRIIPMDAAGNAGTAIAFPAELIVRTPDAPNFAAVFVNATTRVTFNAAA